MKLLSEFDLSGLYWLGGYIVLSLMMNRLKNVNESKKQKAGNEGDLNDLEKAIEFMLHIDSEGAKLIETIAVDDMCTGEYGNLVKGLIYVLQKL